MILSAGLLTLLIPVRAQAQVFIPMTPSNWTLYYGFNSNESSIPIQSPTGLDAPFPQTQWCGTPGTAGSDCGDALYGFIHSQKKGLSLSGTLVATFAVITSPSNPGTSVSFDWETEAGNTCFGVPATTRFYIQDTQVGQGQVNNYRWWANPTSYVLQDSGGTVTLSVPLTSDQWSNTFGTFGTGNLKAFNGTISNADRIGLVYGGGCFFGHGVSVSQGTATFELQSFGTQ